MGGTRCSGSFAWKPRMGRHLALGGCLVMMFMIGNIGTAEAMNNGLAKKPPMAWSNWNIAGCTVNETFIRQQADLLVKNGLKAAGYEYIIVDDCWSNSQRSADGKLEANTTSFPSGMKPLSDYIHGLGLKFGMYADAGNLTCGFHPGSLGHETADAASFAEWGVDYLKYDNCHATAQDNVIDRYSAMSKALNQTGRPVLFSVVGWGVGDPWKGWGQTWGNTWRTDADILQSWPEITRVLDNSVGLMKYSKPYAWADMDMLEVGVGALTFQEMRAHFSLWALMKSPLMLGTDLSKISDDQLKLVTNTEIIAVNQDDLGVPGDQVWKEGPYEIYAAPMKDGARVVSMLNRHTTSSQYKQEPMTVNWEWIGLPSGTKANVRNILDKQDLGVHADSYSGQVIVHDVLMLRITPVKPLKTSKQWLPWDNRQYTYVEGSGLSGGSIAVIVVGSILGGLLLIGVIFFIFQACRKRSQNSSYRKYDSNESQTPKARASPLPRRENELV